MKQRNDNDNLALGRMDFDNLFKTVMHRYFWDGLQIFSHALYADADTTQEPEFLEQELEKVVFDQPHGSNRTDLLARIPMKSGGEQWILCHLELQGQGGGDLPTRMNKYRAMIYLKHDAEPVAFAVLTSPRPKDEPHSYVSQRYETRVVYEYKNIDVRDLDDNQLLAGDNRIALILYAAKRAQESRNDERRKFRYLRDISNIWADRGWENEEKRVIMLAIEYLMNLKDPDYAKLMSDHFKTLEKEGKIVEYVTIAERVGKAEGHEEGKLEVAHNMLKNGLSIDDVVKYTNLPRSMIEAVQ